MTLSFFLIVLAFATPFPIIYGYFNNSTNDSQEIREINDEIESYKWLIEESFETPFPEIYGYFNNLTNDSQGIREINNETPVTFLWNHLGNMQQERMSQQFPIKIEDTQNFPQIDEQNPTEYFWNHLANMQQERMAQEFENQPQNRAKRFAGAIDILRRILAPGEDRWRPNIPYVVLTQNRGVMRENGAIYTMSPPAINHLEYSGNGRGVINENGRINENSYHQTRPSFGEARKK